MKLNPDQLGAALRLQEFMLDPAQKFVGVFGYAGTGKSATVAAVLREFPTVSMAMTAPTHKAVGVLAGMGSKAEALGSTSLIDGKKLASTSWTPEYNTVHSLLGLRPAKNKTSGEMTFEVNHRAVKVHNFRVLVVDECSMLDTKLWTHITDAAAAYGTKVICMGDPLQLPPVSDSMELSESFDVESKTLSQIMRYDGIISDAVAMPRNALIDNVLDRNMLPGAGGTPESFVELHKGAPFKDRVMELVRAGEDVKIIAYTNRTVDALNRVVRRELYGGDVEDYLVGERLVANESYVVNDSIVLYNEQQVEVMEAERSPFHSPDFTASVWKLSLKADDGSTCQVLTVAPEDMGAYNKALAQLKAKAIKKRNWKDFYALKEQFAWLKPPFACTVHKSQGSSFKYCAVDYSDIMGTTRYDLNMRARLLYVAYSRAMNGLIIKH